MEEIYFQILAETIAGARHENYGRTVAVAKFAASMVTGDDQDGEVLRYRPNEDEALKKQRKDATNTLTKYVLARPRKYWKKVGRVDGVTQTLKSDAATEERLAEIWAVMSDFSGHRSAFDWLVWRLEFLGVTDPNAAIIYERRDTFDLDGQIAKTHVYPVSVPSKNVLNFSQTSGGIDWIVVSFPRAETVGGATTFYEDFYLYAPGLILRLREASPKTKQQETERVALLPKNGKSTSYYFSRIQNGTTETPAMFAGAYEDEKTNQESFTTWFDPAEHVLKDIIKTKMLLDVTTLVHAFAKRWEYVRPCKHTTEKGERCIGGYLNGNRASVCPACSGSGSSATFTTEQQVVQLAMPASVNEVFDLAKLAHTENLPNDVLQFLVSELERAERRVLNAVFNNDILDRPTVEKTATEINFQYEDLYDVLRAFTSLVERHWEKIARISAQYLEIPGLVANLRFPRDMKMKPLESLLEEYQKAKDSGAGHEVTRRILSQIYAKQNEDNPDEIARLEARENWRPFADKTPEEIAAVLSLRSDTDPDRILYENFNVIFREIDNEQVPAFHKLSYEMQKQIIAAKVSEYAGTAENTPPQAQTN